MEGVRCAGLGQRPQHIRRVTRLGQQDSVRRPARDLQRLGAAHPGEDRRRIGRWLVEPNVVEVDVSTVDGHRVAAQQRAHGLEDLLQGGQRRGRPHAHLGHPCLDAVPDAGQQPAGTEGVEGGEFHGRHRRRARDRRQDAHTDGEPLGSGDRRRGQAHPGRVEAVLDDPELIGAAGVEAAGEVGDERGRKGAIEAHSDLGARLMHDQTVASGSDGYGRPEMGCGV
jgi:hypothetical protein